MSTKIQSGSNAAGIANVDANYNLQVNLPNDEAYAGYAAVAACHDDGLVTTTREILELDASADYRLRTGTDNILFNEVFSGTTINTTKWATPLSTATVAQAGGFLTLNANASVTSTQGCILKSWKTFPVYAAFGIYLELRVSLATISFENTTSEWGLGITAGTVNATATDGTFFRHTTAGLSCVVVNNGIELVNSVVSPTQLTSIGFDITKVNHYVIFTDDDSVEFWVNDIMLYQYMLLNSTTPNITSAQEPFIYARVYLTANNTLVAQKLNISSVSVSIADMETALSFPHKMALGHESACLVPSNGVATGSSLTAGITNTAIPAVGTAAVTTAGLTGGTVGLGGYNSLANATGPTLTASSAWIFFTYQVPVPIVAAPISPAKSLMITGWDIMLTSLVIAGTNASVIPLAIEMNFGCTNISPATAEAITTQTTPVKGVRRVILGFGSAPINTPIGSNIATISWKPLDPILCEAGTFVQLTIRPLVTWVLANTQQITMAASPSGYWM